MSGAKFIWVHKQMPDFILLEARRGECQIYAPERTCNLIEDEDGGSLHCSNCGGAAEKQSWAYWNYCPNCRAKVVER